MAVLRAVRRGAENLFVVLFGAAAGVGLSEAVPW